MPTTEEIALAKATLLASKGYDPKFINGKTNVTLSKILNTTQKTFLPKVEGNKSKILNYTNLSIAYHKNRKIPYFSAYNIDGALEKDDTVRMNTFLADPRIDEAYQLNKKFYEGQKGVTEFAIGHMASHKEVSWGEDAQTKSYQSFFFPNSVPQTVRLNSGIWKSLESYLIEETSQIDQNKKICVFTGPFIMNTDPIYINDNSFKIPILFYKVIIFSTEKGIFSTAFVMSQEERIKELNLIDSKAKIAVADKFAPDFSDFIYKKVFQVNIDLIEENTGLKFRWSGVKPIKIAAKLNQLKIIRSIKNAEDADNLSGKNAVLGKNPVKKIVTKKLNMILV